MDNNNSAAEQSKAPKRASRLGQTKIYLAKHFRIFLHEKGWTFILFSALISIIVVFVVGGKMFKTYDATKSGFFAMISAAIWTGLFNSIQTICKERSIIKYEHRTGLHMSSYIFSHVIYQAVICFAQALIMTIICFIFIKFPEEYHVFLPAFLEYFITFFLVMMSSDMMGIAISSIVKTPNAAMTVMPFVLIIQLLMSGVLFSLSGASKAVASFTVSKWGMEGLGCIGNMNDIPSSFQIKLENAGYNDVASQVHPAFKEAYEPIAENLLSVWGILLVFCVVLAVISIVSLEFIDKDK